MNEEQIVSPLTMTIAEKVMEMITRERLKIGETCESVGLSRGTFNKYRRGEIEMGVERIAEFMRFFNQPASFFFGEITAANSEIRKLRTELSETNRQLAETRGKLLDCYEKLQY